MPEPVIHGFIRTSAFSRVFLTALWSIGVISGWCLSLHLEESSILLLSGFNHLQAAPSGLFLVSFGSLVMYAVILALGQIWAVYTFSFMDVFLLSYVLLGVGVAQGNVFSRDLVIFWLLFLMRQWFCYHFISHRSYHLAGIFLLLLALTSVVVRLSGNK